MQALQEEIHEDWIFIFPNLNKLYEIDIFDDGNERFNIYDNTWVKFGEWRGKVALFNYYSRDIIIRSISEWKLKEKEGALG